MPAPAVVAATIFAITIGIPATGVAQTRPTERIAALHDRFAAAKTTEARIDVVRELGQFGCRDDVLNLFDRYARHDDIELVDYVTMTAGMIATSKDTAVVMLLTRQLGHRDPRVQRAAVIGLMGKNVDLHLSRLAKKKGLDPTVKSALDVALNASKKVLTGFLVADYSDNRVIRLDAKGTQMAALDSLFGVWDAEPLSNGNYLLTLFSTSRVVETTKTGKVVWEFEDLKNPYDADRLPNGNTLIADSFGSRVIEVDRRGKIVWKYTADNFRPYDADRLPNGNTLIADGKGGRVIEVDRKSEIVWNIQRVPNVHDADRLPNGNTLVTIRMLNEVREIDAKGGIAWRLKDLSSPSDADRLPDGRTLVAENGRVRIFDAKGEQLWAKEITWAVEANPLWELPTAPADGTPEQAAKPANKKKDSAGKGKQ